MNSFIVGKPWLDRGIYIWFLCVWALLNARTTFQYPWANSSLNVPYIFMFVLPTTLMIAHIIWVSFTTWTLIIGLYSVSGIYAAYLSIDNALGYVQVVKWDWWMACANILLMLAVLVLPMSVLALTKPRRRTN